jgi:drug/metabolite transporter (DMT)-like permease
MDSHTRPHGGHALFAVAVIIGGANFLAVRVSNRELEPFWGAGLRFSLAAALFVAYVLARRLQWPRGRQLLLTLLYGLVGISGFYALMYWALVRVTAGAATVVLALVPLVTLILAALLGMERLSRRAIAGALLALAGIGWMVLGPGQVELPLPALLAMLGATLCTGVSVIVGKIVSGNHPAVTNAIALSMGAASLLAMSAVAGEQWSLPQQTEVAWSLAYLVILGSVGLFVLLLLVVLRLVPGGDAVSRRLAAR